MIKKSEILEVVKEALLQTHHYGGAPDEREEFRKESEWQRMLGAVSVFDEIDKLGLLEYEDDCIYKDVK